jgi:hypothetical protein
MVILIEAIIITKGFGPETHTHGKFMGAYQMPPSVFQAAGR